MTDHPGTVAPPCGEQLDPATGATAALAGFSRENQDLVERYFRVLPAYIAPQKLDFSTVNFLLDMARRDERKRAADAAGRIIAP